MLFYCLRMGRCMLAAMSAVYQRMFAADCAHYARQRDGVGGPVINHELPRLALGRMPRAALQSRTLSHLSLQQDADGVDLAGLRDLTKSAAAGTAPASITACERVLGGRSFDERGLRKRRWVYLFVNLCFQLELTRTQIPLQRFGKGIESEQSSLIDGVQPQHFAHDWR